MSSTDWRRQKVEDHKFDFIDVEDYIDSSVWRKFKYSLVFAIVIKGILLYCADLWTAVNLLVSGTWSSNLGVSNDQISFRDIKISFEIYKWVFAACIILSFILLAWDIKKAMAIIKSRDISYAFTSMIAYRYYAIKSYAHFCLFERIHNSKKQIDEVALFCFFTFRGWKRLMFADGPRQVINGIILVTVFTKSRRRRPDGTYELDLEFWNFQDLKLLNRVTIGIMIFTLTLWIISVLLMIAAVFLYIPLVLQIQGNLKEFCCHKIDKRIDEIVKKKARQRAQEASKNAKDGKGGDTHQQKPTLPNISLIEEGHNSPMPGAPRVVLPHIPASPGIRKTQPVQDPYRRQHPPRPYSPGPRSYTPSLNDDGDTNPLRQENHQQHYHNRNVRLDQQYDFSDDRSEISDGTYSTYATVVSKPHGHGHQREGSDTSFLGQGRSSSPHLRQGQVVPRDAFMYGEVMMSDLGRKGVHGAY
ncbi:hypothetical protein CPC16_002402 [Podila verticillata]|uniref:Uncharacterized protein n=1 Tax=Podila verticillata NRRL 6337 TaxID=1069443 RepID=A0A086TK06_9FUNG|nr:hypothetical protein BGZ52_004776 [Haplosporangium bisporale]KAF9372486.1 hypothetical protein CPC16_002402 [Podila verticillata]KFH62283.1 hypothetical protein MVEG_11494 [Podila verticillata NRRL 6337]